MGREEGDAFWLRSWVATASSRDLKHWTNATLIRFPNWKWYLSEDLRFLAPLPRVERDGSITLWFSTAPATSRTERAIRAATSHDGINFELLPEDHGRGSLQPAGEEYETQDTGMRAWRDPFLLEGPGDTLWMYLAAHLPRADNMMQTLRMCGISGSDCEEGWFRGVIGVAVSQGGRPWLLLPPAARSETVTYMEINPVSIARTLQTGFWEMERPQVVMHDGLYHLFFHCWTTMVNPEWGRQRFNSSTWPHPDGHDTTIYHFTAPHPSGPFEPNSGRPVVRGSWATGLYGTHFFELSPSEAIGKARTAVAGWYPADHTLEISGRFRLQWSNGIPEICDMHAEEKGHYRKVAKAAKELRQKRGPPERMPPVEIIMCSKM